MEKLREYTVGELVMNFDRLRKPLSSREREKRKGPYPYYGAACVFDYVDDYLFDGDYILLGEDGTVINEDGTPVLQRISGKTWVNNHAHVLRNSEIIDFDYLYYALKNSNFTSAVTGAVQPKISQANMNSVKILIHVEKEEQKKIARVLKMLDDKIEANAQINNNLFEQAQALYTSMFITNADPSWQQGRLSDLITVRYGKDHKKLADGVYPVYGSGGIMRYAERPLYEHESVLIPRKGTLNNVMYVNEPFWSVDTMFYTEMRVPNVAKFVYHFVKSKDLASMNAGSAVPSMTTDILNAMELAIPSELALAQCETLVAPMYRAMKANDIQTAQLINLRDSILPKLMSGELDVSAIEI